MHVSSYKIYSRSQSKLGTVQRMTSTNDKVASSTHVALLVGATGLVGHAVLALLLADASYTAIHVAGRRAPSMQHPKLVLHISASL